MDIIIINGGKRLTGKVRVNGSKNATLPIMAASLLFDGTTVIKGVPSLRDVFVMKEVLNYLGAKVEQQGDTFHIDASKVKPLEISEKLMRKMRASGLVLGSLLARFGRAFISYPGGCDIGSRPMDLHLKGLAALGTNIKDDAGMILAQSKRLVGADIHLDVPSVGATENIMMSAVLAEGVTLIRNAAREPEIVDLQNFLNNIGAQVTGAGTDVIRIGGVKELQPAVHTVIPDRIEAGTYMTAAAITGGDIILENVIPEHVEPVTAKLRETGVRVLTGERWIRVQGTERPRPVDIRTMPFPGFPTDMQPQMVALLSLASGVSIVTETIFENRFKHVAELKRMGCMIRIEGSTAIINGVSKIYGAHVEATDLRAGAALLLAGLAAEGQTVVEGTSHIDRGYEKIEERYRSLGADIQRVSN